MTSGTNVPDIGDLPEDDPLAPWRPRAPWPDEEKELWEELLDASDGNEALAFEKLEARFEAVQNDPESIEKYRLFSVLTRIALALETDNSLSAPEAINGLALRFFHAGSQRPACSLFAQALETSRATLGSDHPSTLNSLNNLAFCYKALGEAPRALPLYEEALAKCRAVLGEEHPSTLTSLSNLANCYETLGEARRALPLYEEALAKRRAVLGEANPHTLISLHNLAVCYEALGEARRALPLFEEVLADCRAVLGEEHTFTLTSLNNLAECYRTLGETRRALPLYEEGLVKRLQVFGDKHPDTLMSLNNLAECYRTLGEAHRALPIHETVLAKRRAVLGEANPDTLISLNNLAVCYEALGEARRALPLFEEVLADCRAVLGEEHPFTLTSLNNLAGCYRKLGETRRALPLYEEALSKRNVQLGAEHLDTLSSLSDLTYCQLKLLMDADAATSVEMLLAALAISEGRNANWYDLSVKSTILACVLFFSGQSLRWHAPFRQISRSFLEDLDLTDPRDVDHILGPFREFHGNWLKLCLAEGAAEEIPHVLSAISGREVAAMLLSELEAGEAEYADGDSRKLYLETVMKLRQLRMALRAAEGGDGPGGGLGGLDGSGRALPLDAEAAMRIVEQRRANAEALRREHDALMGEYEALRKRIADEHEDFALAYTPPDVSVEALSQELDEDEAIVLLFQHAANDDEGPVPHACCITADGSAGVMVLDRLPEIREAMNAAGLRGTARTGMRGGAGIAMAERKAKAMSGEQMEEAVQARESEGEPPDLEGAMRAALWEPLQGRYPGVTRWKLATHQDHLLPVQLGAAPDHQTRFHPGLPFLARRQEQAPADDAMPSRDVAPVRLAMHNDPALKGGNPIPFVAAEVNLVRAIWGEDHVVVTTGEATLAELDRGDPPLDALLLAAHGDELGTEPPQTIVYLDHAGERTLDTTQVLASAQRPGTVIASACVAGRVREDEGEPLGLVSSFLVHGSRFVLAPLQPVPDITMPIVVGLYHRAWKTGCDPRKAWDIARRQALTGDWPEGYADQLRDAYAPVMRRMLEDVAANSLSPEAVQRTGWTVSNVDLSRLATARGEGEPTEPLIDTLLQQGLKQILDEQVQARKGKPSDSITRITNWTLPYGG